MMANPSMAVMIAPSPTSLPKKVRDRIRTYSKVLLGNKDRIDVAVAIALSQDKAVNATDLANELGLVNSRVRTQLLAFAEVGLLSETPASGELKRWYLRQNSPFWQACLDLYLEWIE
jgi:hypothetical protein